MTAAVCLRRINEVRAIGASTDAAYLFRSRLNRMLLSVQRLVADQVGIPVELPRILPVPSHLPERTIQLVELTNVLVAQGRRLAQRSEPLDERWRAGWRELSERLDELEQVLIGTGDRP